MIYVSNSLLRRVFITYVYRCNCCLLFIGRHFHYVILRMVDILAVTATQSIVQSASQNWCLILDTPHSTGFWENVYKRRRDKGIIYWSTRGFHWSTGLGVYPDHVNTRFFKSLLAKNPAITAGYDPNWIQTWTLLWANKNPVFVWLSWIVCSSHFSIRPKRVVLFGLRSEIWNKTTRPMARLFGLPVEGDHACSPSLISIGMII